jgi:hypothetical protein
MRACASVSARERFEPHAGLHRENAALASGGLNFSLVSIFLLDTLCGLAGTVKAVAMYGRML